MSALFIHKGNVFEPTELTRGPWDATAQHGGAPAALLIGEMEKIGEGRPFARVSMRLLKPVPLTPLEVTTTVLRDGRFVRHLEAELSANGSPVCVANAIQIAKPTEPMPRVPLEGEPITDPPESGAHPPRFSEDPQFAGDGIEPRFVRGHLTEPGPATAWFRLQHPVVEGEEITQLQRTMAAADFPNGISSAVSWKEYLFINPDVTVYLLREPQGEWIGVDAVTSIDPCGIGLAQATLHDARGPFGRALQSLYVAKR